MATLLASTHHAIIYEQRGQYAKMKTGSLWTMTEVNVVIRR